MQWSQKIRKEHAWMYQAVEVMPLQDLVVGFLTPRLAMAGMTIDSVFYPSDKERDDKFGELPTYIRDFDSSNRLELIMRCCPDPLPTESKSTDIWTRQRPQWMRLWHGVSPFSLFGVMSDQKLRAGPRRKLDKAAIYQHKDGEVAQAAAYSIWTPLFNDGYYYRLLFETRTDYNDRVGKSNQSTDQYYGSEESTHIYSLHMLR
jgi:hypothetical protein